MTALLITFLVFVGSQVLEAYTKVQAFLVDPSSPNKIKQWAMNKFGATKGQFLVKLPYILAVGAIVYFFRGQVQSLLFIAALIALSGVIVYLNVDKVKAHFNIK